MMMMMLPLFDWYCEIYYVKRCGVGEHEQHRKVFMFLSFRNVQELMIQHETIVKRIHEKMISKMKPSIHLIPYFVFYHRPSTSHDCSLY